MAVRDIPGRPVVGHFSFTPYPVLLPKPGSDRVPIIKVRKK